MNFSSGVTTSALVPWKFTLDNPEYDIQHVCQLALTPSLAFTTPPKPTVNKLHIFELKPHLLDKEKKIVSGAQIEATLMIRSVFDIPLKNSNGVQRGAFLGDQTGLGKSRIISMVLYEQYKNPRFQDTKFLWVSCNPVLACAARAELNAIGCDDLPVIVFGCADVDDPDHELNHDIEKAIMFTTYSALRSRPACLFKLLTWLTKYYSGVIVLDESHMCKNRNATSSRIVWLQNQLPYARILYVTATVGTSASHLWYMSRLGLWGKNCPFKNVVDFERKIEKWGINGMELIANFLQKQGSFIARQLNVKGIEFEKYSMHLTEEQRTIYNLSTILWTALLGCVKEIPGGPKKQRAKRREYWCKHLRFFQALIQSFKAPAIAEIRKKYPEDEYSIVVSIQDTGEDPLKSCPYEIKDNQEFSLCRELLRSALRKFEIEPKSKAGDINTESNESIVSSVFPLLAQSFGKNPLDQVIENLGDSNKVAEITGRRWIHTKNQIQRPGFPTYIMKRRDFDMQKEIEMFQQQEKSAAVISQKGATGISLHADSSRLIGTSKTIKKRIHVIYQTPWVPENAIQQIGRTNRTGQAFPPKYVVPTTQITGEQRFVQTFLDRFSRMGAICHGERKSGNNISDGFDDLFKEAPHLAPQAVSILLRLISDGNHPNKKLFEYVDSVDLLSKTKKEYSGGIERFLNRTLGLPIDAQKELIKELELVYSRLLKAWQAEGLLDPSMKELTSTWTLIINSSDVCGIGARAVKLLEVIADRGVSYQNLQSAIKSIRESYGKRPIYFYNDEEIVCGFENTVLKPKDGSAARVLFYNFYTPWSGELLKWSAEKYSDWIKYDTKHSDDVTDAFIEKKWTDMYKKGESLKFCIHVLRGERAKCNDETCRIESSGCRRFKFFLLTGCLLYVWDKIRETFQPNVATSGRPKIPLQIVRITTEPNNADEGPQRHLGIYVPKKVANIVRKSMKRLYENSESDESSDFEDDSEYSVQHKSTREQLSKLDTEWAFFKKHGHEMRKRKRQEGLGNKAKKPKNEDSDLEVDSNLGYDNSDEISNDSGSEDDNDSGSGDDNDSGSGDDNDSGSGDDVF